MPWALAGIACAGDDAGTTPAVVEVPVDDEPTGEPALEVVVGAPAMPAEPPASSTFTVEGYIVAVAANGGEPIVGTTLGAYRMVGGSALVLDVWGDAPSTPLESGAVRALARRVDNVLVVAEAGVFHTLADKLVVSPASDALSALNVRGVHVVGGGDDEIVWLVADGGMYRLDKGALTRWGVEGATGDPTVMYASPKRVIVAYGTELYAFDLGKSSAERVSHPMGRIHQLAEGTGGAIYVAAEHGLFVQSPEGGWTQYTLGDDPDAPRAAHALVFDPLRGMYVVGDAGVALHDPDAWAVEGIAVLPDTPEEAPRFAASDDFGTVWIGDGRTLSGMALGTPPSFETDVQPVLTQYCMDCHAAPGAHNAPPVDLDVYETAVEYASAIALRISTGQMPPASADAQLPPEGIEIVLRWKASGMNP